MAELLEAAVTDADPLEVMPPVAGPPGWNAQRRQAFLDFHRARSISSDQPVETTYIIVVDDQVVGAARLQPTEEVVEAGVWIVAGTGIPLFSGGFDPTSFELAGTQALQSGAVVLTYAKE